MPVGGIVVWVGMKPLWLATTRKRLWRVRAPRTRDLVTAAPLSHQRPTIYIWTIGKRHIVSWVICVPHMKWISQKGTEPWSGNEKTFKRPVTLTFGPLTQKWCAKHRYLNGWCVYHVWSELVKKGRSMERTRKNLRTACVTLTFWPEMVHATSSHHGLCVYHIGSESVKKWWRPRADTAEPSNEQCDLDFWSFDLEMMRDTSSPYGLFVYHIWSESVKKGRSHRADTTKPSNDPCDRDLWFFYPGMVRDTWPYPRRK